MFARVFLALFLVAYPASTTGFSAPVHAGDRKSEIVAFNTKSYKFHCVNCAAAKRCTRNCINITRAEAKSRGGVPCKICGGSCSIAD